MDDEEQPHVGELLAPYETDVSKHTFSNVIFMIRLPYLFRGMIFIPDSINLRTALSNCWNRSGPRAAAICCT